MPNNILKIPEGLPIVFILKTPESNMNYSPNLLFTNNA